MQPETEEEELSLDLTISHKYTNALTYTCTKQLNRVKAPPFVPLVALRSHNSMTSNSSMKPAPSLLYGRRLVLRDSSSSVDR